MKVERLQLMVSMLREVAAGTWKQSVNPSIGSITVASGVKFSIRTWLRGTEGTDCGFVACAVGHACLDSRFNALGLHEIAAVPRYAPTAEDEQDLVTTLDWRAVKTFFGIDTVTAEWLFHGDTYMDEDMAPTVENVIARIETEIGVFLRGQAVADDQLLKDVQP